MTTLDLFDAESALAAVAGARPPLAIGSDVGIDHIAWAITELESAGLHPSLSSIVQVLGCGSQREIKALVNTFYRQRAEVREAAAAPIPERERTLKDALDVLARHARRELQTEFASEREHLQEARQEVELQRVNAEGLIKLADEKQQTAHALEEALRKELEDGRQERIAVQAKLDAVTHELACEHQACIDARAQLELAIAERGELRTDLEQRRDEVVTLRAETTHSENTQAALEEKLLQTTKEAQELHDRHASSVLREKAQEQRNRELLRKIAQLEAVHARLARERATKARLEESVRDLNQRCSTLQRLVTLRSRVAERAEHQLEVVTAANVVLKGRLQQVVTDQRGLRGQHARLERMHRELVRSFRAFRVQAL